jgi:holo-[acyl-carrier protein] synthase
MKIGTDIIKINRIEKLIEKYGDKFKQRYLSSKEISMARKIETLAGLWAAKEAISKALGCGICSELTFHDIIITKDHRGAPYFLLSKDAQKAHHVIKSSLSISHDGGFAIAVVALTTA